VKDRLARFGEHYECLAEPFQWKFTRDDLRRLLYRLREDQRLHKAA